MSYSQDIFWNNIPYTKSRSYKKMGFLSDNLEKYSFLKDIRNPYYIWTGTGRIHSLEKLQLNSKIKNKLQKKEVYFYLYEPLCARIGNHNRTFYSEFNSEDNLKNIIVDEFESIRIFAKNHNLINFKIFTCDYNIQLIQENYPDLKIFCLDTFVRSFSNSYKKILEIDNNITKKFWCGNWRYTLHRHLIMSYLSALDGTYTWNLKCSFEQMPSNNWFDLDKFYQDYPDRYHQLEKGADYLYHNILSIDQNITAVSVNNIVDVCIPGSGAPAGNQQFLHSYKNNFCAVVNETRYAQPFGNFSEKTLAAVWSKVPFILVAPPHTLSYLKTFGFKTFSNWWDESYDSEEDHYKRIIKIFDLIDYINLKSLDELKIIYAEMFDVLEHNKEILKNLSFNNTVL